MPTLTGNLRKMQAEPGSGQQAVRYRLVLDDQDSSVLQPGDQLTLRWLGKIHCQHCGRTTRKSYSQGYCYPCSTRLAACDTCMMSPERCHFAAGTCREPDWAERVCFQPHVVYLANSSALKVGITRQGQMPTRWLDQGATEALPILATASRQLAGLVEQVLRQSVSDRTNWRAMLRGDPPPVDLVGHRDQFRQQYQSPQHFCYPVSRYPDRITSLDFSRSAEISGALQGIKGQYLMFEQGVINIRKFTGYQVEVQHQPGQVDGAASGISSATPDLFDR